uniref:Putative vegetative cell wall protein gp1 n=1 Tax=Ixodes ricinus TaxID=34613 RepID=A0A147BTT3_IXORI
MDTLRGTICLWLSLMCAGVQCWPNVRLSSREEEAEGMCTITMNFYIDESVNATQDKVQKYLQTVTWQARNDLKSYFLVDGINIKYWIRTLDQELRLKDALNFDKRNPLAYPDGAINALLASFDGKSNPDINVLLTDIKLYKGNDIRKAYGYSEYKTLCQNVMPMLLAYAPKTPYSAGRMLAEMTRNSVNTDDVPYVHNRRGSDFREKMKNYLRKCGKVPEHPGEENPATPPQEKPTDNPDHTETPLPPDTATPTAEPPTPAPPAPQPPAPQPPPPKPPAPEPSEETPSEPGEKSTPPPEPTTTTGVPDYC